MTDEKDKQRRISKAARDMRERYKLEKRIDDTGRMDSHVHPAERLEREETILREWYPDVFGTQASIADFRNIRARHRPQIQKWTQAFLDLHPVDHQRDEHAIEAWAAQVAKPANPDRQMMIAAVRLEITMSINEETSAQKERRHAKLKAAHDRMTEARRKAAVDDGDLDRARPGYYVGSGWHGIIDDLVTEFAEIEGLGFLSAHEKWGGLRIAYLYDGHRHADVEAIVKRARDRCLVSCWYCGQAGQLKQERWWRVRCEEHWDVK